MFFTSSYLHMLKRVEDSWEEEEELSNENIDSKSSSPFLQPSKKSRRFLQILKGAKEKLHKKIQDSDESGNFSEASGYFGDDEVENCQIRYGESSEYDVVNSVKLIQLQKRPQSLALKHNRRKPKAHTSPFALEEYFIIETPDDFAYSGPTGACRDTHLYRRYESSEEPWSPDNPYVGTEQCDGGLHKEFREIIKQKTDKELLCQDFCIECHQPVYCGNHKPNVTVNSSVRDSDKKLEWRSDVLLQLQSLNQRIREQFGEYESCFFERCSCTCHGKKNGGYLEEYNSVLKYVRSQLDLAETGMEFNLVFPSYNVGTLQAINQNRTENLCRAKTIFREFSPKHDVDDSICTSNAESETSDLVQIPDDAILWWRENVLEQLKVRNYWESKSFCDKEIVEHQKIQAHPELEEFFIISVRENVSADTLSLGTV